MRVFDLPAPRIFSLILLLLHVIPVFAASPAPLPPSPVSLWGVVQVFAGLLVVLATVAGSAWLLKKLAPGQVSARGALKLVGGIAVGPKERIVVVEVGDTWLVVGVAPGQVSAIHQLPKIHNQTEDFGPSSKCETLFSSRLKTFLSRQSQNEGT